MRMVRPRNERDSTKEALGEVKFFCERVLGGELYYQEIPDYLVLCNAGRTISYRELANILHTLMDPDFIDKLEKVLRDYLGDFEITLRLEDGSEIKIKYQSGWKILNLNLERVKNFNIPKDRINYVYPDSVEESTSMFNGAVEINGRAKGFLHNNKLYAGAWVRAVVHTNYRTLDENEIREMIKEMKDILEELLANPKNFANFK